MISEKNKNAIKVLKKAIAILTPRGAWCQGALERKGGAYCAMGALGKATSGSSFDSADITAKLSVRKVIGGSIVGYNDYVAKRKSQVIAKFRKAIKLLESGATF